MDKHKSDIIKSILQDKLSSNTEDLNSHMNISFKSSELSCDFRKSGNKLYAKKSNNQSLEEIFNLYSKSVAYAVPDSEDLELAYGNRSAVLQRMNKFEDCISDINRALKIGKSKIYIKIKILCRKVECLAALGSVECKEVYEEIQSLLPYIDDQSNNNNNNNSTIISNLKKALEAVTNLSVRPSLNYKKPKKIPEHMKILKEKENQNPSNTYTVHNDKITGKQLIASRDIEPGEIIVVEKPYVSCVKLSHFNNYCGHCFVKTWSSIPCDHCNWCMFCSEECKKLAFQNYHDIECVVISFAPIRLFEIDYCDQLSLRSLIIGMRESGDIHKFINSLKTTEDLIGNTEKGCENNSMLSNGFLSVYMLGNKISNQRFLGKYLESVGNILKILSRCTSFFGKDFEASNNINISQDDEVLFIGSVLLKLIDKYNTFALKFQIENSQILRTDQQSEYFSWGACVTPLTSFIGHNCNPNAKACFSSNNKLIVYSLQPIKKNSQIQIGYQYTFFEMKKKTRYESISKLLYINCDCEACSDDWPTINEMYEMPKKKPRQYALCYNKVESDLFDENNALVKPIINGHDNVRFNQKTIRCLVKAMNKALKCLEQPSVVICELMICLNVTFEKLYGSSLLR